MQTFIKTFIKFTAFTLIILSLFTAQVIGQSKFDTLTKRMQMLFANDSLPGLSVVLVNARGLFTKRTLVMPM